MNFYEKFREALRGTPLEGLAEKLKAAYDLRDDDPVWVYAATTAVGSAPLARDLQAVERGLTRLPDTLESSMRASGVEIVKGLAQDIAGETSAAIKGETLSTFIQVAEKLEQAVFDLVAEARTATEDSTQTVGANVAAVSEAMSLASSSLIVAAGKVGGWTSQRIVTALLALGIGVGGAAAMFVAGAMVHADDVVTGCSGRVAHVTGLLRLDAHRSNAVRNYICKG